MTRLDDILLGILDFTPQTKAQSMEAAQKEAIKALMLELIGTGYGEDGIANYNDGIMAYIEGMRRKVEEL